MSHPLHKLIGSILSDISLPSDYTLLLDPACGGKHNLPLFCSTEKSPANEFTDVDALILKDIWVRLIMEIEEANVGPRQVCGKILAAALSPYFIHRLFDYEPILMANSVAFVQILDTSKIKKDKSTKMEQWGNLEKEIQRVIPIEGSRIDQYKIFWGDLEGFREGVVRERFIDFIKSNL